MTKYEFAQNIIALNETLPNNIELSLHVYKDRIGITLENTELPYGERTLYSDYFIKFDKLERAMKHLQIELDAL